mmetsp:Transcript_62300/g.184331  ORF Transcript_62300/g.184331 Transcript_62300/m.184331 type:complete len:229 (-) Transcript_62300:257-943(-)
MSQAGVGAEGPEGAPGLEPRVGSAQPRPTMGGGHTRRRRRRRRRGFQVRRQGGEDQQEAPPRRPSHALPGAGARWAGLAVAVPRSRRRRREADGGRPVRERQEGRGLPPFRVRDQVLPVSTPGGSGRVAFPGHYAQGRQASERPHQQEVHVRTNSIVLGRQSFRNEQYRGRRRDDRRRRRRRSSAIGPHRPWPRRLLPPFHTLQRPRRVPSLQIPRAPRGIRALRLRH